MGKNHSLIGKEFKIGTSGFIRVIDLMGDDNAVVQAARVSYGSGTKTINEDRGLINYLMRHNHTTPFEMCEIKLHIRAPMDTWRQWIRHRTASVNEYSTRYSVAIDEQELTEPMNWRIQSKGNKQGSNGYLDDKIGEELSKEEFDLINISKMVYNKRLSLGVAREQARKDLPLSTYTEAYWKINLHNLLNFLQLRCDSHAQEEIRDYALIINEHILQEWCPLVAGAFSAYRINSMRLSQYEALVLEKINQGHGKTAIAYAKSFGWLPESGFELKNNREREEAEEKFKTLGINNPWGLDYAKRRKTTGSRKTKEKSKKALCGSGKAV